jgi:hypothetical protein
MKFTDLKRLGERVFGYEIIMIQLKVRPYVSRKPQ